MLALLRLLVLGIWLLAVLAAGIDMVVVWVGQLHGEGQPGDVYMPMSERVGLLVLMAALPPMLAWTLWRISARLARLRLPVSRGVMP
jgi:hypothetical protein